MVPFILKALAKPYLCLNCSRKLNERSFAFARARARKIFATARVLGCSNVCLMETDALMHVTILLQRNLST